MTVLFCSTRPLHRAENIKAVYEAYQGKKMFARIGYGDVSYFDTCNVVVTDEFIEHADKPRQKIVMIAHGLTGGKLYGNDQPNGIFKGRCETTGLIDYYVVSSERGRGFAASASGISIDRCLPLGMPRTDAYFGAKKGDGMTFLRNYKRAYLYAPTFRAYYDQSRPYIDLEAIDELLKDDEVFAVKRHMVESSPLVGFKSEKVIEIDNGVPSMPVLIDCDVVLTDYSSIMFDAYVLRKPVVLAVDDSESYLQTRGMYMKYPDEYCSRIVNAFRNPWGLLEQLRNACETGMQEADYDCLESTASACDGHSSERVVELIESLL